MSESRRRPKTYKPKPPVSIGAARCLRVSGKALFVRIGLNAYWIPQSAIDAESEVYAFGPVMASWSERLTRGIY